MRNICFIFCLSANRRLQLQGMQKSEERSKLQKIRQKLRERLSLNNVHNEIELISNMNKHLEITFDSIRNLELLSKLKKEEVLQVLQGIGFLKVFKNSSNQQEYVRLQYENAHKILLITGIQKPFIEQMLNRFNHMSRRTNQTGYGKPFYAKIVNTNIYWNTIETSSEEVAAALKKYLRNQKKNYDQDPKKLSYKIERRRIRIIIVKEDLFTLLIDAMTQYKAQLFQKNFILLPNQLQERRKSQELSNSPTIQTSKPTILYRPLLYNSLQNYSAKNEQKEQQFSDGFSQSNSLNSQIIDAAKMKDIIQTSDQGIQSQNNIAPPSENILNNASIQANSALSQRKLLYYNQQLTNNELENQQKSTLLKPNLQNQLVLCKVENVQMEKKESDEKMMLQMEREDLFCTYKHSPLYKKAQTSEKLGQASDLRKQSFTQTQEPLYTVISNALMRRLMQQFKNKNHSQLIQLPEWMKSESQNQRNRHRFFSSLCKPKLITQRKLQ